MTRTVWLSVHLDRLLHDRRELRRLDGHAVGPDRQQRQPEEAVGAGHALAREAGFEVRADEPRAGDAARGLVGDGAFDRAGRILGPGGAGAGQDAHQHEAGGEHGSHVRGTVALHFSVGQ